MKNPKKNAPDESEAYRRPATALWKQRQDERIGMHRQRVRWRCDLISSRAVEMTGRLSPSGGQSTYTRTLNTVNMHRSSNRKESRA